MNVDTAASALFAARFIRPRAGPLDTPNTSALDAAARDGTRVTLSAAGRQKAARETIAATPNSSRAACNAANASGVAGNSPPMQNEALTPDLASLARQVEQERQDVEVSMYRALLRASLNPTARYEIRMEDGRFRVPGNPEAEAALNSDPTLAGAASTLLAKEAQVIQTRAQGAYRQAIAQGMTPDAAGEILARIVTTATRAAGFTLQHGALSLNASATLDATLPTAFA